MDLPRWLFALLHIGRPSLAIPVLTPEIIQQSVGAIREQFKNQMKDLLQLASADPFIARLELYLWPGMAAEQFPVQPYGSTQDGQDPNTQTSNTIIDFFKNNRPLLAPPFKTLPIGRFDVAGLDFTQEATWISNALIAEIQAIWNEVHGVCRPTLNVFISLDPDLYNEPHAEFLNLQSGCWEKRTNPVGRA
jgi:hypothetical protein